MLRGGRFRKIRRGLCEQSVRFDRKGIRRYAKQRGKSCIRHIASFFSLNLLGSRKRQFCSSTRGVRSRPELVLRQRSNHLFQNLRALDTGSCRYDRLLGRCNC